MYGLFPLVKFLIPILVITAVILTVYLVVEYKWGWDRLKRNRDKKDLRDSWI